MASITDELERIGEQTASILVVAHDQAHETTRLAQEQAERCVADAAANAVADHRRGQGSKLRELDAETDAVWRERERLLEDVRTVSAALANLADQASERFPAAEPASATGSFHAGGRARARDLGGARARGGAGAEPRPRAVQRAGGTTPEATDESQDDDPERRNRARRHRQLARGP